MNMKPPGSGIISSPPAGGGPEIRREIPIPQGTILYIDDVAHLGKTPEEQRKLEGVSSFGVTGIKEISLSETDVMNFFPKKDWDAVSKKKILATQVFFRGIGQGKDKKDIIVEKINLTAEEINQIIKICFQLDLAEQYYRFSQDVLERTSGLVNKIGPSLEQYSVARSINPALFGENGSDVSSNDLVGSIEKEVTEQLADIGLLVEKLQQSVPVTIGNINSMVKQLDDLGVIVFNKAPFSQGMWWPVKVFVEEHFPHKY
jgi:hypothetical protein